jgi:hypothetical protein
LSQARLELGKIAVAAELLALLKMISCFTGAGSKKLQIISGLDNESLDRLLASKCAMS